MPRLLPVLLAASLAAASCGAALAADAPQQSPRLDAARCAVPDSLFVQDQALPHVGFKLRNGLPIKIVAIGSSSTQGHGASDPGRSYPARLAAELSELWPRAQLAVINRGIGGERTAQMMARFERDVLAEKPDLVIWQVGTNESLAGDTIYSMRELIIEGIDTLEMAGADVIVMSPQYAPRFNEKPDHLLRVEAVRSAAFLKNVGVFRRFEIMQNWVARGNMSVDAMITADGLHMNDLSYGCTAHLLARQIAGASRGMPLIAIKPAPMASPAMAAPSIGNAPMTAKPVQAVPVASSGVAASAIMPSAAPNAGVSAAPAISPNTLR